jgi:acyl-CoA reductase-like NAD-dependent aldehyde dehydrogenase
MQVRDTIYVAGEWTRSAASESIEVVDPTSEKVIGKVPAGTAGDVDRAVAAARRAFPAWSATSAEERAGYLGKLRETLDACATEMAATITAEMGAPPKIARNVQVGTPLAVLKAVAELLPSYAFEEKIGNSLVVREPIGVVGAITPWNYPLHQVVAKLSAALAAGCTVVLKPSEVAPLSAYLLFELIDSIGLPPGAVNLVSGTGPVVGERIAAHPGVDMVSFTGSTAAGRRVAEVAAQTVKRVALELGGKSPGVVLPDADLETAVPAVVRNAFLNSGQTCTALTRLLVDRERYEDAVALAAEAAEAMASKLGPLVSSGQYDRVQGYIEKGIAEGAEVAAGGLGRPEGQEQGYFARPTVFAGVRPDMTIAQEEIFGPVLCVLPYDDEDDAARIANGTPYGLAGGVWSADDEHALAFARRLRTGQVDVNGGRFNPVAPFGGYKQSGVGRELGRYGLEEFLEVKAIQLPARFSS